METPMVGCVTKLALEIEGHLDIFISNRRVRSAKSRSEPYVPLDLCSDILSRLPVKSLLRFRCVSKSWRSLIDDPQFCYLHSNACKNNSHETHLLILELNLDSHSLSSLIVCRQTLEKTRWIFALAGIDTEKEEGWYDLFSVDGLVMLTNRRHEVMLWNPSIRRCRRIPQFRRPDPLGQIGIGFDPVSKDYKYVKTFYRDRRQRVAVYSIRTNSWKTRRPRAREDLSWSPDPPVSFRGSLYSTREQKVLVSFSLSTMVFTHESLPLVMSDKRICLGLALVDGGSTLAAIGQPWHGPGDCIIWALETNSTSNSKSGGGGVSVCWTKRYTIISMDFERILFYPMSGGDVVFQRRYGVSSKVGLVSYNIETQEERILQRQCSQWTPDVTVYKESLVLLN